MASPFTLLQIIPSLNAGGAERTTVEIARAVIETGGRSLIASSGGSFSGALAQLGADLIEMPVHSKSPAVIWSNAQRLAEIVSREQVSLVHARSRAPGWSARSAAKRTGVPYVATHHGMYRADNRWKRIYSAGLTKADIVIANSRFIADAMVSGGVDEKRIRVIPRGADMDMFNGALVNQTRVKSLEQHWALKDAGQLLEIRCLLPARFTDWKGHKVAIEAAAILKNAKGYGHEHKISLVFCGGARDGGNYKTSLRAYVDECGVADMVRIVGECADMAAAYQWADIVVAPSTKPEPFGRTVIEAGAMETPVIASAHGGACETIIDQTTGYLIAPNSAPALADTIDHLVKIGAKARADIGQRARDHIDQNFSCSAMCSATLHVYEELLGNSVGAQSC